MDLMVVCVPANGYNTDVVNLHRDPKDNVISHQEKFSVRHRRDEIQQPPAKTNHNECNSFKSDAGSDIILKIRTRPPRR